MKRLLAGLLFLAAAAAIDSPLIGQEVRGTVVEATTERPLAGAFVRLIDDRGSTLTSALTGEDGAYVILAPSAGTFRIQVERIGYQSWRSGAFAVAPGETVTRRLAIPVQAVRLEDISVAVQSRCAARSGDPELVRVWDEVRKALELNRWTEGESDIRFAIRRWTRNVREPSGRVVDQDARPIERRTGQPFVSAPPELLAEEGWAIPDPESGWRFFGPDAQALLSDAFSNTHCFTLTREQGDDTGLIGLAFEPVSSATVDIAGTLWLDPTTAELRHLEYRYTDLYYGDSRQDASGRVDFARLPTGHWFVRDWVIRMPVPVPRTRSRGRGLQAVSQYRHAGGDVIEVELPGGRTLDLSEWGAVTGVVTAAADAPAAGADLQLRGTVYRVRADDEGRFRFPAVPPGAYLLVGRHADLAALGGSGTEQTIEVEANGETRVRLRLRPRTETLAELCPGAEPGSGVAYGSVGTAGAEGPVADASVWIAAGQAIESSGQATPVNAPGVHDPAAGAPDEEWSGVVVESDSLGTFLACGIPDGTVIVAQAGSATAASDTVHREVDASSPLHLELELAEGLTPLEQFVSAGQPIDLEAEVDRILAAAEANVEEDRGSTTLVGTVRAAETGQPVSGARVTLLGHEGERVTGAQGTFVFSDLKRGRYRVVTERLGLASDTAEVDLRTGAGTMATLMLETDPVRLPDLEVEVERTFHNRRLAGYFKRLDRGLGDFVTRQDLEFRDVISNFRRIPFVRIDQCLTPDGRRIPDCWDLRIARGGGPSMNPLAPCPPLLFVDGMLYSNTLSEAIAEGGAVAGRLTNPFTLLQNLPRDRLEGIEVYRNAGLAPPQYRMMGDACGIVLVWTRGR